MLSRLASILTSLRRESNRESHGAYIKVRTHRNAQRSVLVDALISTSTGLTFFSSFLWIFCAVLRTARARQNKTTYSSALCNPVVGSSNFLCDDDRLSFARDDRRRSAIQIACSGLPQAVIVLHLTPYRDAH